MPMNSNLTSSTEKPPRYPIVRNLISAARAYLGRLVSFAVARVLMIFLVGFAAGIGWQSFGGGDRKAVAGWSPYLAWLAPAAPPAGTSPDRFKAISLALATTRQNLDKLAKEIGKVQAQDGEAPRASNPGSRPSARGSTTSHR